MHTLRLLFLAAPLALALAVPAPAPAQSQVPGEPGQADTEPDDQVPELPPTTVIGEPAGAGDADAELTTTPTLTEIPISQSGSSLTVITREQIENSEFTQASDVLRGVRGLDVVQLGPTGGITTVFLRGAESRQTKVLLDGMPINDPSNASRLFDFSILSVDEIERIEVLRGPQSTVYGSDAIGGVINITTRKGEGPLSIRPLFMGGSFGTHREGVSLSGGTDLYHYSIGGSYFDSDGFSAAARRLGNFERDGYRLGTISGRFGVWLAENVELQYIFRWIDSDADIDDAPFSVGTPPTDDPLRRNLTETYFQRVQLDWSACCGLIDQTVAFNVVDYDRSDLDDLFPSNFTGQAKEVEWRADLLMLRNNTFTVGADYLQEEDLNTFSAGLRKQNLAGLYLQDQVSLFDRAFLTAGYRFDEHSAAGSAETYRFTGVYELHETGTAVRASLGTGFRAPALSEIAFGPDLRPERSKGWDYGLEQRLFGGDVLVGCTYFRNDFRDLIQFDFATFTLRNIASARSTGVEVWGEWELNPCTVLSFTYTRTDTLDLDTGLPLLRRPRDKGAVGLGRRFWCDRAYLGARMLIVGDRLDAPDGSVILDDYIVVNVSGHYNLSDRARLFFRIDNLTDTQYEEATGFETADLSGYGGLRLTW